MSARHSRRSLRNRLRGKSRRVRFGLLDHVRDQGWIILQGTWR